MQATIVVSPDASPARRALLRHLADAGVPDGAEVIYSGRRNTLYRVTADDGTDLCVKAYRIPPFPNMWVYGRLRHSKARRAYDNARRLLSLGLATPAPVGYVETWRHGTFGHSYYVCRYLAEVDTVRDLGNLPDSDNVIRGLARLMTALRRAGINFTDFSPGNILYSPDGYGGYCYSLVDINRMRFDDYSREATLGMFRAITLDDDTLTRLATAYAEASGDDPAVILDAARARLAAYHRRQSRKRILHRLAGRR